MQTRRTISSPRCLRSFTFKSSHFRLEKDSRNFLCPFRRHWPLLHQHVWGFSFLSAFLRGASSPQVSSGEIPIIWRKATMWPKKRAKVKTAVALPRKETSVWKPNVNSRPLSWKRRKGTLGYPGDELDPCHRGPYGGRRGEGKDLAVRRAAIILRASRRRGYCFLSCGQKGASQETGLTTEAGGKCFRW